MPLLCGEWSQYGQGIDSLGEGTLGEEGWHLLVYSFWLHWHVFWEHIGDIVPGVAIQTLLQSLLVQVVSWRDTKMKHRYRLKRYLPSCTHHCPWWYICLYTKIIYQWIPCCAQGQRCHSGHQFPQTHQLHPWTRKIVNLNRERQPIKDIILLVLYINYNFDNISDMQALYI